MSNRKHLAHIIAHHAKLASGGGRIVRMCRCDLCRFATKQLEKKHGQAKDPSGMG